MATSVEDVPAAALTRPSIALLPQTIRGKLALAFGVVAATAIVAGVVGQSSYQVVNEKLATITGVSLPSMVAAQRIGEVTAQVVAAAPALHGAATQTELQAQLDRLNARLAELQPSVEQLAQLSDDADRVRRLNVLAGRVAPMFEAQADNVRGRLHVAARSRLKVAQLIDEHLRFNGAIKPTIEADKQAFALSSRKIIDATEQSLDHLSQLSMKGLFPILTLRVQATAMARALSAGARAATDAEIDATWQKFVAANSVASRQLDELERNPALAGLLEIAPLQEVFSQFTSLGVADPNVFDRRREQLAAPAGADGEASGAAELEERLAALEAELERSLNVMVTLIRGRTATEAVDLHQDVSSTLDRMTTEGLGGIGDLQELEALGNQIVGVLTVATRLESAADLASFEDSFAAAAARMDSILATYAGDPRLRQIEESAQRILGFGRGAQDVFADRGAELQAIALGEHLLGESLALVEDLSATAAQIVATTRIGSAQAAGAAGNALERARWTLFGAGGAGLLTLLLVWLYARRSLVGPIRALQAGAARIGGGNLAERIDITTGDELEALADEFNNMARQLQESYASLERKIEERTQELSEALERQTATSEVLNVISRSTTELQPVLDTIVATAARLCHAEWAIIRKLESDGTYHLAAAIGSDDKFLRYVSRNPVVVGRGTLVGRTVVEGRTLHLPDVIQDPEYTWHEAQEKGGYRTALCAPLLRGGAVIGVIFLARNVVRPFTDKEIELVTTFADQAVIAIENVRLFDEVQARTRELTEALEYQTAITDVLGIISRLPTDVQPVFDAIVQCASRLCDAEFSAVTRFDGELLHLAAFSNMSPEETAAYHTVFPRPPTRGFIVGRALLEGAAVQVEDVTTDPEYDPGTLEILQRAAPYRSYLGIPIGRPEAPIGAIGLGRRKVLPFTERQIELVQTFASQAVIAIENARLFEEVEARTRELTEALEQQTATSAILRVISTSPADAQPVFETIVRNAVALCGSLFANVFRFDGELLQFVASHNVGPDYVELLRAKYPMRPDSSQVSGRAVLTGSVVRLEDALADPDYDHRFPAAIGWRRMLGVPMLRQGEPLGVIVVGWAEAGPVPKAQEELLKQFADQAVIAIENVRLFDEVQARTRELTRSVAELRALGEVSQAVNSTLELQAVLRAIAAHAVAVAGADAGVFCAFEESAQVFHIQATHELDSEVVEALTRRPVHLGEGAIGTAGLRRAAVQIPDVDQEAGYALYDIIRKPGYRALLAVPLVREDSLVGGLVICRKTPGAFASETVNLVQTLANQSVLAIENAELFEEIEEKGRQLEEANRHKSEFLANMSHELRTPLNAVLGYAELIQDGIYGEVSPKIHDVLERIQQNGRHLLGLINDVLDLAKIEAGQLTLSPVDYSLRALVLEVVSATEALATEKQLALEVEAPADLPAGHGDERRITQVLMNLVSNAIKFTDTGSVRIRASVEGDHFVVAVADTGVGIAAEDQARIFGEFQQVDSSSTRSKGGTGLGLAITQRIVELHGGQIGVDSRPGEGSTFTFTLLRSVEKEVAAA